MQGSRMNLGIYLYDNAEVLDFSSPFEVFSTAKRLGAKNWNVFLVSELMDPVVAREGYRVLPHYSFENHPEIDVLVVVGGISSEERIGSYCRNKCFVFSELMDQWIKNKSRYSVSSRMQIVIGKGKGFFLLYTSHIFHFKIHVAIFHS